MAEATSETKGHTRSTLMAGVIGNVMEWYDFALYGYFAPVFSMLFFPSESATASLLATFGVFAAGFIMRPIGSVLFGYIGDKWNRRKALFLSVVLMGLPTFFLGALPTHAQIGVMAPILLVVIRLVQGLSVGGEFSSSVTYVVETSPLDQRGLSGSWANVGSMGGMLLGSGLAALVTTTLPDSAVSSWGWRFPFLFGGVIAIFATYMRRTLSPSQIFEEHEARQTKRSPVKLALTQNRRETIKAFLFASGYAVCFYIPLVYLPTYVDQFTAIPLSQALQVNSIGTVLLLGFIPLMGFISDQYIRRKHILLIAFLVMAVVSYPLFHLFNFNNLLLILVGQIVFAFLIAVPLGSAPATLVELFPTEDRLSGYSISFNTAMGVVGGTTPMMSTWLISISGNNFAPSIYLTLFGLIAVAGLAKMIDGSREPLK